MRKGTVRFFNRDKGYGFVTPDDDCTDVFVHITNVVNVDTIAEGDRVEFELGVSPRSGKSQAVSVTVLS